jgi:hypothetical protein
MGEVNRIEAMLKTLSSMSKEELIKIGKGVDKLIDEKDTQYFKYLVRNAVEALNKLTTEFPTAELYLDIHCGECRNIESVNVLEYFDEFKEEDFSF